jgi:type II secretory pathway component GspD/PulD (secretin)
VLQQISLEVRQCVAGLIRQAHETMTYGQGEAQARCRQAEQKLGQARQLASAFGQDVRAIDDKVAEVRRLASGRPAPSQAVVQTSASQPPARNQGQVYLEHARLELTKGETRTARRMCELAMTGKFGVDTEAVMLLRTIDAEELNQKALAANRSFDVALRAFTNGETQQASAIIGQIDLRMLTPDRQARLREVGLTPEMRSATSVARNDTPPAPGRPSAVVQTGATGQPGTGFTQTAGVGRATATDRTAGELDRYKARQKILYEKLRAEGLAVQSKASEKFRSGQQQAALDDLQEYLEDLERQQLDPGQINTLKRPVEGRLASFRLLKTQSDLVKGNKPGHGKAMEQVMSAVRAEDQKHKNVERLMKDFNAKYREAKYTEALAYATRAKEVDPDNAIVTAAVEICKRQMRLTDYRDIKDRRERTVLNALNSSDDEGDPEAIRNDYTINKERWNQAKNRKPLTSLPVRGKRPEAEKEIERRLSSPVRLSFENAPLKQVIDDLRVTHGLNIFEDQKAYQELGVSMDSPVSIKLDNVSLKSALNLILSQVKLTHVVQNEVLTITSEENARGKLVTVTYPVGDLVIPIENFGEVRQPDQPNFGGTPNTFQPPTPITGLNTLPSQSASNVGTPSGAPLAGNGGNNNFNVKRTSSNTQEEQLIKLLTNTVQPNSWMLQGGSGTIDYYPLTMALVINQTADIQEQIADLLAALRRLQDQEVAVEVRFISVSEDFFERIGVQFNMNILTNNQRFEPALQNNAFSIDPNLFINQFRPTRFLAGATQAGTLTPTLSVPIPDGSFLPTIPTVGGYLPGAGLTMGLAFLSDIQLYLFMEAVQGDLRSNIMQAPKLTMFNGQTATITVSDQLPFLTSVQVVPVAGSPGNFAVQPIITPLPTQIQLSIQAVISADRRFVRMSLAPNITSVSPIVSTFPVTFPLFTSQEGNSTTQQGPIVFTQFIQQPNFRTVSVQTTVSVPDGGTVLMGGLKRLAETRSEYGPPILSKIPYVDRLFKNVGYGRSTESLLIMVTPRIIIQEEEEERQTGFIRPNTVGPFAAQ